MPNVNGFWNYTVDGKWLDTGDVQPAFLLFAPYACKGTATQIAPVMGPTVVLRNAPSVTVIPPSNRDRNLGLAIGLPLVFVAVLAFFLFVWRSHFS